MESETSAEAEDASIIRKTRDNDNSLVFEISDPQNEEVLSSPFAEALKAQQEVDEKVSIISHRHQYIPRQKKGEITREHEQYNLTYAMMMGIRHSVQTWQTPTDTHASRHRTLEAVQIRDMKQGVSEKHFFSAYKYVFPPEGGKGEDPLTKTPPHLLKTEFKFKDYSPEVFARLRKRFEISDADYLTSLCSSFNYLEFISNSKSGEFFFYSHDGRFLIKTQRKSESKFMRSILSQYYYYVADNPNSLLVRICGAHRVKLPHLRRRMHFVIMMSVFADASELKPVNRIYDLKGATRGRKAQEGETVRKDLDVIADKQYFHLGPKRNEFLSQIEKDSKFLAELGVMDYSLLVGIHEKDKNILMKPTGSFVFRSDRKSSLQHMGSSEHINVNDTSMVIAPLTEGKTSTLSSTPSLPLMFSNKQVLNYSPSNAIAPGNALSNNENGGGSSKSSLIENNKTSPPTSPLISRQTQQQLQLVARLQSSEGFNSFYKIDSRDANNNFTGETYHVGIIDIFTSYSTKKRAEHVYKSLQGSGQSVSAVPPKQYQARFLKFLSKLTVAD